MSSKYQPEAISTREGKIGLCLSGGGYRATLFHLGSLRRLNEVGLLSKIDAFSSVSGGSIANGLLAKVWPNLTKNADGVFVNLESEFEKPLRDFCSKNIRTYPLLWGRLSPLNWPRFWFKGQSATNLLADTYASKLLGDLRLKHLADIRSAGGPAFLFCATNFQLGVNFVFGHATQGGDSIGDYKIGRAKAGDIRLAEAVASSSAFPIAFPQLVLKLNPARYKFTGGKLKDDPEWPRLTERILLTDGGVYDNLGLEPIWKDYATVFCSDGGAPFKPAARPRAFIIPRLVHAQNIIGNQARAVRKRWLISSFENKLYGGGYWGLTSDIADYKTTVEGYRDKTLELIAKVRTDLDSFSEGEQLVLMNHGWALTNAALRAHYPAAPSPPGTPPSANLLANAFDAQKAVGRS